MVEGVAALAVIDEFVQVDVEPELTHPVVMCAPPLVGENVGVGHEFKGETTAGSTQCGDVVEESVLSRVRQVDQQAFGAPRRWSLRIESRGPQRSWPVVAKVHGD